jgi:hypothetical protein
MIFNFQTKLIPRELAGQKVRGHFLIRKVNRERLGSIEPFRGCLNRVWVNVEGVPATVNTNMGLVRVYSQLAPCKAAGIKMILDIYSKKRKIMEGLPPERRPI